MTIIHRLAGFAGLGIAAAVALAPNAHAEINAYGQQGDASTVAFSMELSDTGWLTDNTQAWTIANNVCNMRASGSTERGITNLLINQGGHTIEQAVVMVNGAEWHFCPAYYVSASA